jgi:hypothetical protein
MVKEATLTTGEKIIVNVDEIRLMHWIQDATTIRFAKDHGVQIKETPETPDDEQDPPEYVALSSTPCWPCSIAAQARLLRVWNAIFAAEDWSAQRGLKTMSPRRDQKSETATREKWPRKRLFC